MRSSNELTGAFQVLLGQHGTWLQIWIDALQPDSSNLRALIGHALAVVTERRLVYSALYSLQRFSRWAG